MQSRQELSIRPSSQAWWCVRRQLVEVDEGKGSWGSSESAQCEWQRFKRKEKCEPFTFAIILYSFQSFLIRKASEDDYAEASDTGKITIWRSEQTTLQRLCHYGAVSSWG